MYSVLKFAFIAGMTFLIAAEVAYGQAQAPSYGTSDPGIQQRMQNQEQRIDQGVSSGALTPKEAGKLEAEQAKIRQTEQRMKSDGQLTPNERQKLNNMQDRSSQHIYNQKHDAQTANVGQGGAGVNVNDPNIQQRMQNQERRIQQGVNSGQLTPKEAGRLQAREAKIKQDEARMKSDGQLTAKERKKLNKELDNASDRIYKQKHDRQHVKTN
jgi:CRISPR/Cas system-associated endoribonuclease Cas2